MAQDKCFKYFGWNESPSMKYKQPEKNPNSVGPEKDTGYPQSGIKTSGIEVRGGKAQTKGKMARGPMA